MQADAATVDTTLDAFAMWHYRDRAVAGDEIFYDELAKRKIISVTSRPTATEENHFKAMHPYRWSYLASFDVQMRNEASWICRSLKDRPAAYAKGTQLNKTHPRLRPRLQLTCGRGRSPGALPDRRAAGMWHQAGRRRRPGAGLGRCATERNPADADGEGHHGDLRVQLRAPDVGDEPGLLPRVDLQHVPVQRSGPGRAALRTEPADGPGHRHLVVEQATHGGRFTVDMGAEGSRPDVPVLEPADRLLRRAVPVRVDARHLLWHTGRGAAPHARTFAKGLQSLAFPNPGAGGPPYYQSRLQFGPNDHSGQDDAQVIWWSSTSLSQWTDRGSWCSARLGVRYANGWRDFPADDGGLKQLPCY
jgi:hypothetical protein